MIILDDYGQPDYEAMILERQEQWEIIGNCDNDCEHCLASETCDALYGHWEGKGQNDADRV